MSPRRPNRDGRPVNLLSRSPRVLPVRGNTTAPLNILLSLPPPAMALSLSRRNRYYDALLSLVGVGAGVAGAEGAAAIAPLPMDVNPAASAAQPAVREQDRFMPIANVIRIMRRVLPAHAKIADDAKEMIQECASEYISFITSEANERCQREQRKTVTAEDVLWAMNKLGFDDYIEPLTLFLHRYRELEGDHRGSVRGEPFQLIKHRSFPGAIADTTAASGAQFFATAQLLPPPSLVMPPGTATPQHHSYFNESMVSNILSMYGSGEGPSGGGSSSQVPGMLAFDHPHPSYK